jgi:hypothetical protein
MFYALVRNVVRTALALCQEKAMYIKLWDSFLHCMQKFLGSPHLTIRTPLPVTEDWQTLGDSGPLPRARKLCIVDIDCRDTDTKSRIEAA